MPDMTGTTERPAPSDDMLGLPRLAEIEPSPDVAADPEPDKLGLPDARDVAHRPSLAGIEHLVDPSLPRPPRRPRRSGHGGGERATG